MAREPDNLVLTLLREIRDTLQEHSRMHNQHAEEFSRLNAKMEEWQETTATAAEERLNRLEKSH